MTNAFPRIDPTFGREECKPSEALAESVRMPLRIWSAQSIWQGSVVLSYSFQSPLPSQSSTLWAAADGDFTVRVNGETYGSVENNPLARRLHEFDLADVIRQGVNSIEIEVTPSENGPHSLLVVLDVERDDGIQRIVSDEEWSAQVGTDHAGGVVTVGRLGSEPWGFPSGGPDDLYRGSFGDLRLLPMTSKEILSADAGEGSIDRADSMLADDDTAATVRVADSEAVEPPRTDLVSGWEYSHLRREYENRSQLKWLAEHRRGRPTVLVDFGLELNARLRIELAEPVTALIAVITDETPQAVDQYDTAFCQVLRFEGTTTAVTEVTGMRYARLVFVSADRPIHVRRLVAETIYYPVDFRGSFRCSDELLTRIWDVSAYTLHACMQDYVWDGIKRDQLPWMGDAHVEHLGIYYAFGDVELPRRTLEWLRWHGPPERPINGIDAYSMFWVSGLYDYLLFTGDRTFPSDQQENLLSLLESIEGMTEGGFYKGSSPFIDHAPIHTEEQNGQVAGTQMLLARALREGSMLLGIYGDPTNAVRFMELAGRVRDAAISNYWRSEQGDFGLHRQVNALAIFGGVADDEQAVSAARQRLADGTGNPMTTWQRYYLYEALAKVGMHDRALAEMRTCYGGMLDLGATTFWETYNEGLTGPDFHGQLTTHIGYGGHRISLCHGWAAGPLPWLSGHVLGVVPMRPGFSHCRIQPRPMDLKWFAGTVPTPDGEIAIEAEHEPSGWRLSVDVPQGVHPNLDVSYLDPLVGLVLNGQTAEIG